jgi:hypothetical protein
MHAVLMGADAKLSWECSCNAAAANAEQDAWGRRWILWKKWKMTRHCWQGYEAFT